MSIFKKIYFREFLRFLHDFFVQNEAEDPHFTNQKFFTHLTSFLPPFLNQSSGENKKSRFCDFIGISKYENEGVKTSVGGWVGGCVGG